MQNVYQDWCDLPHLVLVLLHMFMIRVCTSFQSGDDCCSKL